jgi:hypothetical protein
LESLGLPGVFLIAQGFEHDAKEGGKDYGMPTLRTLVIPGFVWGQPGEEKIPLAKASFAKMIEALTHPLTPEETRSKPRGKEVLLPVEITAESYEAALEKFNQLFLDNHWGDGLPLLPPTPERVKWMLAGTSRSPNEVIGKVAPKNGIATIEKIAINAVMAGAKPEYLPVIIGAMEGLADEDYDLLHPQASMGSFNIVVAVTGPIAKELNINSGVGYLGHGWRSNNTIGRAVRLCLINLGHTWPGINDMANLGRQQSHTLYTFAENQDFSPWPPYHVTQGFKPGDSCVTVSTMGSYGGTWGQAFSGGLRIVAFMGTPAEEVLNTVIENILSMREGVFARYKPEVWDVTIIPLKHLFLVPPDMARNFQRLGFTNQESLRDYIYEKTCVPYEQLSPEEIRGIQGKIKISIAGEGLHGNRLPPDRIPVFQEALKPGGKVPVLITPEDIHFMVVGYPVGGTVVETTYHRAPYKWVGHKTKLIRGSTLTKAGR